MFILSIRVIPIMFFGSWKSFSLKSTIHAVPDIQNSTGYKWKAFWIIILLGCTSAAVVEIYRIFDQFEKKPILTTYEYHSLNNITFPKVTICLPHFINATKVIEEKIAPSIVDQVIGSTWGSVELSMMMRAMSIEMSDIPGELSPLLLARNATQALQLAEYLGQLIHKEPKLLLDAATTELSTLFPFTTLNDDLFAVHFEQIKKYVTPQGYLDMTKFLETFGNQLNEILLMCYFNRIRKCEAITSPVFDVMYQSCFLLDVNEPQAIGGIGMALLINTLSSTSAWSSIPALEHGVKMYVSNHYVPFSDSYFGVPAGSNAMLQLRPTHNVLTKGKKYGTCSNENHCTIINHDIAYSDFGCRGDCMLQLLIEKCGCIMYFPSALLLNPNATPICQSFQQLVCLTAVQINSQEDCVSKCKPPCDHWQYSSTISYTKFPSPKLRQWLSKQAWDKNMEDIICIMIGFAEMTYALVSQEDSLTFDGFISQIGGHLGLFLGCSIVSIIQIFVYLLLPLFAPSRNKIYSPQVKDKEVKSFSTVRTRATSTF